MKFWMDRTPEQQDFYEPMLRATLNIYTTILKELLPTPAKTHYTFNLRDLSKVFQGVLMFDPEAILVSVRFVRNATKLTSFRIRRSFY